MSLLVPAAVLTVCLTALAVHTARGVRTLVAIVSGRIPAHRHYAVLTATLGAVAVLAAVRATVTLAARAPLEEAVGAVFLAVLLTMVATATAQALPVTADPGPRTPPR